MPPTQKSLRSLVNRAHVVTLHRNLRSATQCRRQWIGETRPRKSERIWRSGCALRRAFRISRNETAASGYSRTPAQERGLRRTRALTAGTASERRDEVPSFRRKLDTGSGMRAYAFTQPNVPAHRPPSPDLSKFQNSKAPVPSADGGSV
jgi:hypothetical protein